MLLIVLDSMRAENDYEHEHEHEQKMGDDLAFLKSRALPLG
ncbi:MAG: hypothetical protein ABI233_09905 [Chthoniobacterales bacterium]